MLNLLATLWCMIGIIVGFLVLFLAIIGACAMAAEAFRRIGGK